MVESLKSSSYVEFIKTETLTKGRVRTRVFLFLLDPEVFVSVAASFITGETKILECRIGESIKHPKDKHDKKIAKAEAAKRFKKFRLPIKQILAQPEKTTIVCTLDENYRLEITKRNDKIKVYYAGKYEW